MKSNSESLSSSKVVSSHITGRIALTQQQQNHHHHQKQKQTQTQTIDLPRRHLGRQSKLSSIIVSVSIIIGSLILLIPIISLGVVITLSQPAHTTTTQKPHDSSRISWITRMLSPTDNNEMITTTTTTDVVGTTETPPCPLVLQFDPNKSGNLHLIILVHGIFGNSKELNYLEKMLHELALQSSDHWFVHSVTSNVGLTLDGIAAGGHRIAIEINDLVANARTAYTEQLQEGKSKPIISLSIVGHSLGGLYSRYALSEIDFSNVIPAVFCTLVCPHLGVSEYTYVKIPRFAEGAIASGLKQTGSDLFRYNNLLNDMIVQQEFVRPLQNFHHRRAYANAFNTDFQVPFRTSAFLSDTDSIHYYRSTISNETITDEDDKFVALVVETEKKIIEDDTSSKKEVCTTELDGTDDDKTCVVTEQQQLTGDEIATRLDSLGWTKIFCDMRETVASVPKLVTVLQNVAQIGNKWYNKISSRSITTSKSSDSNNSNSIKSQQEPSSEQQKQEDEEQQQQQQKQDYAKLTATQQQQQQQEESNNEKSSYTSSELLTKYSSCTDRWHFPLGHATIVANSKAEWYSELNAAGRPMVKRIAQDLIQLIPQQVS